MLRLFAQLLVMANTVKSNSNDAMSNSDTTKSSKPFSSIRAHTNKSVWQNRCSGSICDRRLQVVLQSSLRWTVTFVERTYCIPKTVEFKFPRINQFRNIRIFKGFTYSFTREAQVKIMIHLREIKTEGYFKHLLHTSGCPSHIFIWYLDCIGRACEGHRAFGA